MHPYRPRLSFARAREYLSWSVAVVPLNVFFYLASRVDAFVVGRMGPAPVLGVYNVAADVSTMLTSDLTSQVGRALYPSYATLVHDAAKLREAYLHSLSLLVIVNVAFGLGLLAVSEDFVAVLLGPKWSTAVPLVQWLAVAGMLRGLAQSLTGNILMVSGKERIAAILMCARFLILGACAIGGAQLDGARGVAIGVTLGMALSVPLGAGTIVHSLDLHARDLLRVAWRPFLAGAFMVLAVRVVHGAPIQNRIAILALEVLTGAAVYVVMQMGLWRASGSPAGPEKILANLLVARMPHKGAVPRA
jgi:O-antigen/teichoic acid export membrane protein